MAKEKSLLEQILTSKQVEWVKNNPNHSEVLGLHAHISEITSTGHSVLYATGLGKPSTKERLEEIKVEMIRLKNWLKSKGIN